EIRANGLSRLQPNRSSGPQPSASARAAQPSSMNRPQSSINRNHRLGEMSQGGGRAGSSRASASAHSRGAPPSYSAMAARSSSGSPHLASSVAAPDDWTLAALATLAGANPDLQFFRRGEWSAAED